MAVTTTVINFPAPNPASGTASARWRYLYTGDTQGGVHVYEKYYKEQENGYSQSTQSANLRSLGFTDGAQIISVVPHATIPLYHRVLFMGSTLMSAQYVSALKTELSSLMANTNRTLSVTYSASAPTPPEEITMGTVTDAVSQTFTTNVYFTACSLTVVWVPAGGSIPEAEDPIHENTDSNALFVINPYGPAKESCGVGVGGWPVGDSADNPTYDCFMKTVFKKPVTIANSSYVYQTPVWKETYGMLGDSYTYRMVNNEIYGAPQFCRVNGTVYVRGYITRSTAPNGAVIFTLPENYRPSQQLTKWCYYEQGSASTAKGYAQVTVKTNGEVTLDSVRPWGNGGAAINTTSSFVNLDFNFRL